MNEMRMWLSVFDDLSKQAELRALDFTSVHSDIMVCKATVDGDRRMLASANA